MVLTLTLALAPVPFPVAFVSPFFFLFLSFSQPVSHDFQKWKRKSSVSARKAGRVVEIYARVHLTGERIGN